MNAPVGRELLPEPLRPNAESREYPGNAPGERSTNCLVSSNGSAPASPSKSDTPKKTLGRRRPKGGS